MIKSIHHVGLTPVAFDGAATLCGFEGHESAGVYYCSPTGSYCLHSCSERSRASASPLSSKTSVERVPFADTPLSTTF